VALYDLAGRMVRRLLDDADAPTGEHLLAVDGRGGQGERLRAGMYFYRIRAMEGTSGGRFVIAR
jgi:hypothetical protein